MSEKQVWSLLNEDGFVVTQVSGEKEQAELVKAQLEASGGPLKIRKGRKHQVQEVEEE